MKKPRHTTFDWYVNLNGTADVKATFTAEGRKKSCIIKLEEIEKISSLHRKENEDNAHIIKNPIVFTFLHRQLSQIGRSSLSFELPLSFEQAAAYRKANGQYVRKNQWRDTTVRVLIDLD